ncbi:MAG: UDP-glucose 4-epimerase GalE [Erysipelotrichaceae bacterium]|nr:UDP-glucose 4-epimerase GalE [Erysipelotrichaceae bacterium]
MAILVTGGAGFIGSHTVVELLEAKKEVIIVDNFYNSSPDVLDKLRTITNKDFKFYEYDVTDYQAMEEVFKDNQIEAIIHFAGYKAVGESVEKPLMYYQNNLDSLFVLCSLMEKYNVTRFVFSSSATVYGNPHTVPIKEDFPLSTTNPYGTTKLMSERILSDIWHAHQDWSVVLLRYFNPIGAHKSGLIGENPKDIPNNLMPYILKVASGELECLNVFGDDYDTPDGTGVRDYIHVVDLAKGHVLAIDKAMKDSGVHIYNLGTGTGYSVLDIVNNFEKYNHIKVNYKITDRRAGDIAMCYADTSKAKEELGFEATKGIKEMCEDAWNFVKNCK